MCFSTMASLRPFDKQPDMWPERADFNLLFPSARAEIKFIYMLDVFTDPDSAPSECKQPAKVSGLNLTGRLGGSCSSARRRLESHTCVCAMTFSRRAGTARFINHKHELMDPITLRRYVCLLSCVKSKESLPPCPGLPPVLVFIKRGNWR